MKYIDGKGMQPETRLERWMWNGTNWMISRPARAAFIGLSVAAGMFCAAGAILVVATGEPWWVAIVRILLAIMNGFAAGWNYRRYVNDYKKGKS